MEVHEECFSNAINFIKLDIVTYLRGVLTFESKLEIVYNLSSPVQCWALPYSAGTNPAPPSTLGNTFKIMNTAKTAPKSTKFILKLFNNVDSFRNWTTSYFSRRGWVVEIFEDETNYALLHGITDKLSNSYVKLMWTNFFLKLFVPLICTYLGHQGRPGLVGLDSRGGLVSGGGPAYDEVCILFCCQISKLTYHRRK